MRNLTIKRVKRFVASFSKVKVYIEDPISSEIRINGVPCRKLGDLKNGDEKTFSIGESAAKVFVIADKYSKNYCNEYYPLPEGEEDIFLSGKNRFNLATGNAFCFENNDSEEVIAHRKQNKRRGAVVMTVALLVGFAIGLLGSSLFWDKEPQAKTYSANGIILTLTDEFERVDTEDYTAAFGSKDVAIIAVKEEFDLFEGFGDYTLDQYLDLTLQANDLRADSVRKENGLACFVYDFQSPSTKETYRYFSYIYKTSDAFWVVQFATSLENADAYEQQIAAWAKAIRFSNETT